MDNLDNIVLCDRRVGAIDFDMCGLGHYPLDLVVPLHGLRLHHADRFEGYEGLRSLPENHEALLKTFDTMLRVAATNRDLQLLASEGTRHQSRGHDFLRYSVAWLQNNYLQDRE